MTTFWKSISLRLLRGFLAGAIGTMLVVQGINSSSWGDVGAWLNTLVIAGVIGGITGLLLAGDKAIRSN